VPPAARETGSWGRIGADILKGISVISHAPWFACPNLNVQIFMGRREYYLDDISIIII
jgi:hypothetical protein